MDAGNFLLKNAMEDLVEQRMQDMLPRMDCCTCERCWLDIKAYTLNHLPIQYVVTPEGELYAKLKSFSNQYSTDIAAKVAEAAKNVRDHPNH